MSLVQLLILLVIVGLVLWLVNTQIPMPGWLKTVINVIAVLGVSVWVLQAFGILDSGSRIRIGH